MGIIRIHLMIYFLQCTRACMELIHLTLSMSLFCIGRELKIILDEKILLQFGSKLFTPKSGGRIFPSLKLHWLSLFLASHRPPFSEEGTLWQKKMLKESGEIWVFWGTHFQSCVENNLAWFFAHCIKTAKHSSVTTKPQFVRPSSIVCCSSL